ncbi:MAG: hypothetical protein QXI37_01500, partial [Thermoprotei archaeon]
MYNPGDKTEKLAGDLLVNIKSVSLLFDSDESFKKFIESKVIDSSDVDVIRFVKALREESKTETGSTFLSALGEMSLAALMVLTGLIILAPAVIGFNTAHIFTQYYSEIL